MSLPATRADQLCVIVTTPMLQVTHYSIVEIKGVLINFSSQELYIGPISWGGVAGKLNPDIPKSLSAHSNSGEIVLLILEINRDEIDPIENMIVGNFALQYSDSAGGHYRTTPALFQLFLR